MPWVKVEGDEILRLIQEGDLTLEVPAVAGIYAWRLNLDSQRPSSYDAIKILKNINSLMTLPQGEVGATQLNHAVQLLGLRLNGREMPHKKAENLYKFMRGSHKNASWVQDYVKALNEFLPNLYVGNSENLAERVVQHVNGSSDFGKKINDNWPRNFSDLSFHYFECSNVPKQILESLEYLAQSLTVSAFTKRAG